jgi:predicted ester cyclase
MSTQNNINVALRFVRLVNDWNWDAMSEVIDPGNYVENNPAWGAIGFEQMRQTYEMVRAALPDVTATPDMDLIVAEGDKVVVRGTIAGTHTGVDFFGVPASGKRLAWTGIDVSRVVDGKIVERWLNADIMGLMQQLGLAPGPG